MTPEDGGARGGEVPEAFVEAARVFYRSVGCGIWGVLLRGAGMPLEKMALFANSSLVQGRHQWRQAVRLTFQDGLLAPYRVIGPASLVAWFLQYSTMTLVFQCCDRVLSEATGCKPVVYGDELKQPQAVAETTVSKAAKDALAALGAAAIESAVSNRAEAQRFYGRAAFATLEPRLQTGLLGPAFAASTARNAAMAYSAFVLTPIAYSALPADLKQPGSFFYFALGVNMFLGNGLAVTTQALWGRTLERCAHAGHAVPMRDVVCHALKTEGPAAFFSSTKWGSRVLMNAPAEGTLAWFYNQLLPLGEPAFLDAATALYNWTGPSIITGRKSR